MPVSFGEVDQRRIAGVSRLLSAAVQQQEQEALLEHQKAVEKDYQQRAQNAALQFGEAMRLAERNPIVANQRLLGIVSGLSASRDPRLHKLAEQYQQNKFPVVNRIQKRTTVETPGYTPTEILEIGPAEDIIVDKKQIGGKKVDTAEDLALKQARTDQAKAAAAKSTATAGTAKEEEIKKVQDKYRQARESLSSLTKTYSVDQLNEWANTFEKYAKPEDLQAINAAETPEQTGAAFVQALKNKVLQEQMNGMDSAKIRTVVQFIRNRAEEAALRGSLKDRNVMYDPVTDSFVPYKETAKPSPATVIDAEAWFKSKIKK